MHILMTGGGTAGHVVPNLAVADAISDLTKKARFDYIGSYSGPERELVLREGIHFERILTGKWRRYFDLRNFVDFFKIAIGTFQAWWKILRLRPDLLFSKGGFVALPVVVAAWVKGVPVLIHESDAVIGLATRLSLPFARKVLLGYEEAKAGLPKGFQNHDRVKVTGNPVRRNLAHGHVGHGKAMTKFSGERPVLLVLGGSSGSEQINQMVTAQRAALCEYFDIVHLLGKGKGEEIREAHYVALNQIHPEELNDLYALASLALSRAGATVLSELETLQIPTLLFPLGLNASRGDQIANANVMIVRHPFFKLGDENKPLTEQLKFLPPRTHSIHENHAAYDIARQILMFAQ